MDAKDNRDKHYIKDYTVITKILDAYSTYRVEVINGAIVAILFLKISCCFKVNKSIGPFIKIIITMLG